MVNRKPDNRNKKPSAVGKADVDPRIVDGILGSGETDKELVFHKLFAALISAITNFDVVDVELIENLLIKLCQMFRLSKAETRTYKNQSQERNELRNGRLRRPRNE